MQNILIITYYWPPSGGAGVQRWLKFSRYLPEFGYTPVILTVDEKMASYAQYDPTLLDEISPDLKIYRTPTFEPYTFYRRLAGKKEIPYGGFTNQKKVTPFEKFARFVRGNLFIPDPRKGWKKYALKKALEILREEKIDAVITSGPPHSTHLIGLSLKKKTGVRWVADFRDPWTDIYYYKELFHSGPAAKYDRYLEKKVLLNADKIITVSQEVGKLLAGKSNGLTEKIAIIPNGYDSVDFENVELADNEMFTITYTGTISKLYRIDQFIEALSQLPGHVRNNLKIRFVGNVPDEILSLFREKQLGSNVEIMGYLPHAQAIRQMMSASALLLAIPDTPDNKGIVTGKFFEYLGAKRPVLAIGPLGGDIENILKKCGAGKIFSYDEAGKMKEFLLELFDKEKIAPHPFKSKEIEMYTRRNLTLELIKNL